MLSEKGLRRAGAAAEIYNTPLLVRPSDKRPEIISLWREIVASRSRGVLTKPKRKFVAQQQAMKGIFQNNYHWWLT